MTPEATTEPDRPARAIPIGRRIALACFVAIVILRIIANFMPRMATFPTALAPVNPSFASGLFGWWHNGSGIDRYTIGVDPDGYAPNHPCGYVKTEHTETGDWNAIMQEFSAHSYLGKRFRLSADIKSDGVSNSNCLWLRVDSPTSFTLSRVPDPLAGKPHSTLSGSTEWRLITIVLDVSENAQGIAYGNSLAGTGKASIANVHVDVVGSSVPLTASYTKQHTWGAGVGVW
jgi:hypothetical protein